MGQAPMGITAINSGLPNHPDPHIMDSDRQARERLRERITNGGRMIS